MTDRLKGVVITFEKDIREDDAEQLLTTFRNIRGVVDVSPIVADLDDHMARARVKSEIREKFWKFYEEILK
jgi:hypothetical protein